MAGKKNYFCLIDKARGGDRESINRLLICVQNNLYFYIYRTTQSCDISEDLLQETLLTILKSINQLQKAENFRAWAHRIAANKIQDYFRDKKRRQNFEVMAFEDLYQAKEFQKSNPVLKILSRQEELENLYSAIEQLDDTYRNIVKLRGLGRVSHQKIAAMTDSNCEQVRSRFYRAKCLLRDKLFSMGMTEVG